MQYPVVSAPQVIRTGGLHICMTYVELMLVYCWPSVAVYANHIAIAGATSYFYLYKHRLSLRVAGGNIDFN